MQWCPRSSEFQFTRAGERATLVGVDFALVGAGFNSRALGSARRNPVSHSRTWTRFNSRALGSARLARLAMRCHAAKFQFTRAGERATSPLFNFACPTAFQFTRAGERATPHVGLERTRKPGFNSRALGSARLTAAIASRMETRFNSRALGSARQQTRKRIAEAIAFQFTRAGERATSHIVLADWRKNVSIHARWGARDVGEDRPARERAAVSIHARWGARDDGDVVHFAEGVVSIHARWGARDRGARKPPPPRPRFNSRALGSARQSRAFGNSLQ